MLQFAEMPTKKVSKSQAVFERAVQNHLSSALYSQLERMDEFQIGAVLIHHKKPRFWRKTKLDFTGLPVQKLILEEDRRDLAEVQEEAGVLFTDTKDHSTAKKHINFHLDGDVSSCIVTCSIIYTSQKLLLRHLLVTSFNS